MKIIQINASYKPAYIYGGPALSVSRLCEGLAKANADIEVLTTTANGPEELAVPVNKETVVDGVRVTYFKRLTKDHTHFSPALYGALKRKLSRGSQAVGGPEVGGSRESQKVRGPEEEQREERRKSARIGGRKDRQEKFIVHIHAWWNLVSVFSCLIAKWKKVPVILTPRGTLSNYSFGNRNAGVKELIHRFLGKSLLEYVHFHVTSEKEKEDILSIVKPKSVRVIPNFVYLPEIESSLIASRDTDIVKLLFLSRIEEKKGLDILFKALAGVDLKYILTIAGKGEEGYVESLKGLSKELGIEDKINWVGQKSQEEKWEVMQKHDMLVLTSHDENFANVVIECLAMGTPVLVSDKVGIAEYVSGKKFGWVCKPEIESVKVVLEEAVSDNATVLYTRENAPAEIRRDFDEKVLIKEFLEMYEEVIEKEL